MPRHESAIGKWNPSVDIRCLLSMMSPEDTAIQPTHAAAAATCATCGFKHRNGQHLISCGFRTMQRLLQDLSSDTEASSPLSHAAPTSL